MIYDKIKSHKKPGLYCFSEKTFFWKIDPQPLGMRIVSTTKRERVNNKIETENNGKSVLEI